jgi:hypothetical protein
LSDAARQEDGSKKGFQMTAIGLGAAFVGYLVGKLLGADSYLRYPQLCNLSESSAQRSPMSSR